MRKESHINLEYSPYRKQPQEGCIHSDWQITSDDAMGFEEHTVLTFLCKSNRALESQNPVLAIVTAGDKSSRVGAAAATYNGVQGRPDRRKESRCPERR